MSVDGVWKVEMMGPYGWEKLATAFLDSGSYLAASTNHYATGSYTVDGEALSGDFEVAQYGKCRAIFGSKKRHVRVTLDAKLKKQDKIVGKVRPKDGKKFEVKLRLTRLGDLE